MAKNGRYGPYVSHDGVNATLPSDMTVDAITLEQAVGLIEARSARGRGKKRAAALRSTARKAPGKAKAAAAPRPPASAGKKPRARKAKAVE